MSAYCTQADIESIYSAANVAIFANPTEADSAPTVTARIADWISDASEEMDERARPLGFQIPLVTDAGTVPPTIVRMTARLAGIIGYEAWGLDSFSPDGKPNHKYWYVRSELDAFWKGVKSGDRVLTALKG